MLCDVSDYFNYGNNTCTNTQFIGQKYLFRGVIVKECVVSDQNRIALKSDNKVIVKSCVEHYHECQKRRCTVLHELEVQNKVLKDEVLATIEEASKEEVEGLRRRAEVHRMKVNEASAQ